MAVTSIMHAQQILLARLTALLIPHGLTFPRYEAPMILHLSSRGAMPLGRIGELLQVHPTSVTSLIDGLERQGYVVRKSDEADRRTTLAAITPEGSAAAEAATQSLNGARFATEPLAPGELEALADDLRADADGEGRHARVSHHRGARCAGLRLGDGVTPPGATSRWTA